MPSLINPRPVLRPITPAIPSRNRGTQATNTRPWTIGTEEPWSPSSSILVDPVVQRVPQTKGWRAYVEHRAAPGVREAEVSVRLTRGGAALSETWRGVVRGEE